ncbi:DUF3298 and DUF4163 domain-containing protein [Lysobacter fragariae]
MLLLALAACRREQQPAATNAPAAANPVPIATAPATTDLKDVVESTSDYIIGVSYPPIASKYPPLAAALKRYADDARNELMQAVQGRQKGEGASLYELSLPFTQLHASPTLVAVGVDGSVFTGGAHSAPLIARWVWLPQANRLLTAQDLVANAAGWEAISDMVREQLHTALSQRVDADELPPSERTEVLKDANKLIDDGTTPDPEHFSQFEPVVGADGKLVALRFVFAPYQVGPYSDGVQTVQVPAAALLPHIAPAYRGLFQGG